jgi:hypothetical protein
VLRGAVILALLLGGLGFLLQNLQLLTIGLVAAGALLGIFLAAYVFKRPRAIRVLSVIFGLVLASVTASIFWLGLVQALGRGTIPEVVAWLSRLLFDMRILGPIALGSLLLAALVDGIPELANRLKQFRWPWQGNKRTNSQNSPG